MSWRVSRLTVGGGRGKVWRWMNATFDDVFQRGGVQGRIGSFVLSLYMAAMSCAVMVRDSQLRFSLPQRNWNLTSKRRELKTTRSHLMPPHSMYLYTGLARPESVLAAGLRHGTGSGKPGQRDRQCLKLLKRISISVWKSSRRSSGGTWTEVCDEQDLWLNVEWNSESTVVTMTDGVNCGSIHNALNVNVTIAVVRLRRPRVSPRPSLNFTGRFPGEETSMTPVVATDKRTDRQTDWHRYCIKRLGLNKACKRAFIRLVAKMAK